MPRDGDARCIVCGRPVVLGVQRGAPKRYDRARCKLLGQLAGRLIKNPTRARRALCEKGVPPHRAAAVVAYLRLVAARRRLRKLIGSTAPPT